VFGEPASECRFARGLGAGQHDALHAREGSAMALSR
jgi:hypothetical protein